MSLTSVWSVRSPLQLDCAGPENIELLVVVPLDENLITGLAILREFERLEDVRYPESCPDLTQGIGKLIPVGRQIARCQVDVGRAGAKLGLVGEASQDKGDLPTELLALLRVEVPVI